MSVPIRALQLIQLKPKIVVELRNQDAFGFRHEPFPGIQQINDAPVAEFSDEWSWWKLREFFTVRNR